MLRRLSLILFLVGLVPKTSHSIENGGFFHPKIGIEVRFIGTSLIQDPTKTVFNPSVIMGCGIDFDAVAIEGHRVGIGAGYLRHMNSKSAGTEQIAVLTSKQQTDFYIYYRYHWKYVSTTAASGISLGVVSVTTRIYNLGAPSISASSDENEYQFTEKKLELEEESHGIILGATLIAAIGLDLGRLIVRDLDNFLFFNLAVQYAERDMRNELCFWTSVSVILPNMTKKTKQNDEI